MTQHVYNWIPDRIDFRDQYLGRVPLRTPDLVDWEQFCPPVKDQGQLGSCTGNGIAGVMEFDQLKQGEPHLPLSRLWIYYQERVLEHSITSDAGAAIRDGIKVIAKQGACVEDDWPYDIKTFQGPPPAQCVPDARLHTAVQYQRVSNSPPAVEGALAAGFPIVFGFSVYSSFESEIVAKTGIVQMPERGESLLGGHCVFMYGYNRTTQRVICQNSWGSTWGNRGRFTLPYQYVTRLASDLWTVQRISA